MDQEPDATGGVIPYKNQQALIAYYLGIFSIIPCIGLFLGIAALVLGILGLKKRAQMPHVKGSVHAWVGIICGSIFGILINGGFMLLFFGGAILSATAN